MKNNIGIDLDDAWNEEDVLIREYLETSINAPNIKIIPDYEKLIQIQILARDYHDVTAKAFKNQPEFLDIVNWIDNAYNSNLIEKLICAQWWRSEINFNGGLLDESIDDLDRIIARKQTFDIDDAHSNPILFNEGLKYINKWKKLNK